MAAMKETYFTKQMKLHAEVRKASILDTSFESKDGKKIEGAVVEILVDDDDTERFYLIDKDPGNLEKYQRGMIGTFTLRVDLERKFGAGNFDAKISVIDFEPDKKGGK